jgi:hypothetical protein
VALVATWLVRFLNGGVVSVSGALWPSGGSWGTSGAWTTGEGKQSAPDVLSTSDGEWDPPLLAGALLTTVEG